MDADAEVSTEMISRVCMTLPSPDPPNTVEPSAWNTSLALAALPSPMPTEPTPAKATVATLTIA